MKKELRQMKKWEKTRQMGKKSFILKYGVLRWGLSVAVIWTIAVYFTLNNDGSLLNFVFLLATALVIFSVGGYFWGLIIWNSSEKKYQKFLVK